MHPSRTAAYLFLESFHAPLGISNAPLLQRELLGLLGEQGLHRILVLLQRLQLPLDSQRPLLVCTLNTLLSRELLFFDTLCGGLQLPCQHDSCFLLQQVDLSELARLELRSLELIPQKFVLHFRREPPLLTLGERLEQKGVPA